MRDEIIAICVEALRKQGHPHATAEIIFIDPALTAAFREMLEACRPLPDVAALIRELDAKEKQR